MGGSPIGQFSINKKYHGLKTFFKNIISYVIFEKIRKDCGGGGLLTVVHKNLEPISVGEDTGEEVLVVEAKLANRKVRLINAYGPQETETEDKKKSFFNKMDEEIKGAKIAGTMVCVELDANSKLGSELNPGDPHPQSKDGKHLENLVIELNLRWSSLYRPPRIEIYNFKKIEDFKKFQSMTENNEAS